MFDFFKKAEVKAVHVNDMDELLGKVELIDIREPEEYSTQSLQNSKNIPMGDLLREPEKYLKKDHTYYIMCQSGGRSGRTTKILSGQGYDVVNVAGGMGSYVGTKKN